jgi:hypothetical protein
MGEFPNKDAQWKPGQSGNPNGVPKGTKQLSTWIQKLLNDEKFEYIILSGKQKGNTITYKGAPVKAIVGVAIHKAMKGDVKWAEWLAKHGYGSKIVVGAEDPVEAALRKLGLWEGEEDAGQDSGTSETTS